MSYVRNVITGVWLGALLLAPCLSLATVSVAPAPSYNGNYTVSWTDTSGGLTKAYLNERVNGGAWAQTAVTGTTSKSFTGKAVATYSYKIQIYVYDGELRKYLFEYETPVVTVQVWTSAPGGPGPIAGPASSENGNYTLSWAPPPGVVTGYVVTENGKAPTDALGEKLKATDIHGREVTVIGASVSIAGRKSGGYVYQVQACNQKGCGPLNAPFSVNVKTNLTTAVLDAELPVNSDEPFAQEWIGRLPGKPSVDGGAARYHVPIEVPPGRRGMQPGLSLDYSSRGGNGIAGVGWSLAAGGSVYRCPRTLESDGGNRPVLLDPSDRLCLDGQRLVQVSSGSYGDVNTEYRTEIDQFARIRILGAGFGSASSYFQVERRDGRVEHYTPQLVNGQPVPDAWRIAREFDRQGNCVRYQYSSLNVPGGGQEVLLTSIVYTGTTNPEIGTVCTVDAGARAVTFGYTWDREDKRTTYRAGYASHAHARLATITTSVGGTAARRLELSYGDVPSRATRRSLLRSVRWCAGTGCGDGYLPPTTFTYGDEPLGHGAMERVADPDAPGTLLGATWYAGVDGDFDGDGTRDQVFASYTDPPSTRSSKMELSSGRAVRQPGEGEPTSVPADWAPAAPLQRSWGFHAPPSLDVDMDGRADLVAGNSGKIYAVSLRPDAADPAFANWVGVALRDPALHEEPEKQVLTGETAYPRDFDGDGRVDLLVRSNPSYVARNIGDGASGPVFDSTVLSGPPLCIYNPHWSCDDERDFNGDGTLDRWNNQIDSFPGESRLTFFRGFGTGSSAEVSIESLDGPAGDFGHTQGRTWIDVNGDGLPDIWQPGTVYLNKGSAYGEAPTFAEYSISAIQGLDAAGRLDSSTLSSTLSSLERRRLKFAMAVDYDSDGVEELMVPATRVVWYCGRNPASYPTWPPEVPHTWCGDQFDEPQAMDSLDRSVFTWDAFKVLPDGAGGFMMVRIPTTYTARVGSDPVGNTAPVDLNGDGLTDAAFTLFERSMTTSGNQAIPFGWYFDGTALGPYRVIAEGTAPDLIEQVIDGLGASVSWKHRPLSKKVEEVTGDDPPDDPSCDWDNPFYLAHNDNLPQADRDAGNVLFTSSMWAAASMRESNAAAGGASSATNLTCYRYEDAMLNVRGRGFMGFKKIVAEERLPSTLFEDAVTDQALIRPGVSLPKGKGTDGTCGQQEEGPKCSKNNLRTTTEFNQTFPFTNTARRVTVESTSDSKLLSESVTLLHGRQSLAGKPWTVLPVLSLSKRYDPSAAGNAELSTVVEIKEFDSETGEPTKACKLDIDLGILNSTGILGVPAYFDGAGGGSATTVQGKQAWPHVYSETVRALTFGESERTAWWLGRVSVTTSWTDLADAGEINAYLHYWTFGAHPLQSTASNNVAAPTCLHTFTAAKRGQTTALQWNEANAARVETRRQPLATTTRKGGDASGPFERSETFDYGPYGQPSTRIVQARAVQVGGALQSLSSTFAASPDGYFIEKETNAAGHTAWTIRDPASGQVQWRQAIQGGPTETTTFDKLGRVLQVQGDGEQAQELRQVSCATAMSRYSPSAPLCGPGDVLVIQTTQKGMPTRLDFLDARGRTTRSAIGDSDGASQGHRFVVSEVEYNERGQKVLEYAPYRMGTSLHASREWPTWYSGFDLMGRPGTKGVALSALAVPRADLGARVTNYTYSGVVTKIVADSGGPLALSMWRVFDARGRLVLTAQQHTSDGVKTTPTVRYVYEPSGALVRIVDPGGSVIEAAYDDFGRKKSVQDPDRGLRSYEWDGMGRLTRQESARDGTQFHEVKWTYDAIGRVASRTAGNSTGDKQSATWTYGSDGKAANLTEEADGSFTRSYEYDDMLRPVRVTTKILAQDPGQTVSERTFVMEYGYDRRFNRLKAKRLPTNIGVTGETVGLVYDTLGRLSGEAQLDASYAVVRAYRKVTGWSERGQVTDQYLGNCSLESVVHDPSSGLVHRKVATKPLASLVVLPLDLGGCGAGGDLIRQDDYFFDRFLNLEIQSKNVPAEQHGEPGVEREEHFTYDELQRLTSAGLCTGAGCVPTQRHQFRYDDSGNLKLKTDFSPSQYSYGTSARSTRRAGPHAVVAVPMADGTTRGFSYDLNGNMVESGLVDAEGKIPTPERVVAFDLLDQMQKVTASGVVSTFAYAPSGGRYLQEVGAGDPKFGPKTVYYIDKDYELTVSGDATMVERVYLGEGTIVRMRKDGVTEQVTRVVNYTYTDRLGSIEAATNDDLAATESFTDRHGFDPWGGPRGGDWQSTGDRLNQSGEWSAVSTRGFTGHEHLDSAYLIHMNGRVYDYRLGRFLSVDPIISNPLSSQAINPYSYIGNNPLSGTDPTGYDVCPAGQADKCSGAKPEPSSKPYSMVQARKDGSIAGRGGDNVTVNGFDQNTKAGQAVIARSRSSGADGAGPKATDASNPSRVGAPGTQDQQTPAAGNPPYEPEKWNDGGSRDDGRSIQGNSNCYAYACNQKGPFAGHYGMNPGDASGQPIESESDITAEGIRKRAIGDGLSPVPVKGGYRVYLVVDPGSDYHWYREDSNGKWSQKHGSMPVDNVDASGRPITNPERANHNYGRGTNYSQPGGYLWVPPGFQFRGP